MELDTTDYQWAMVGSSSDRYLWILSRTTRIEPEVYRMLLSSAKKRGYKIDKLITVEQ